MGSIGSQEYTNDILRLERANAVLLNTILFWQKFALNKEVDEYHDIENRPASFALVTNAKAYADSLLAQQIKIPGAIYLTTAHDAIHRCLETAENIRPSSHGEFMLASREWKRSEAQGAIVDRDAKDYLQKLCELLVEMLDLMLDNGVERHLQSYKHGGRELSKDIEAIWQDKTTILHHLRVSTAYLTPNGAVKKEMISIWTRRRPEAILSAIFEKEQKTPSRGTMADVTHVPSGTQRSAESISIPVNIGATGNDLNLNKDKVSEVSSLKEKTDANDGRPVKKPTKRAAEVPELTGHAETSNNPSSTKSKKRKVGGEKASK